MSCLTSCRPWIKTLIRKVLEKIIIDCGNILVRSVPSMNTQNLTLALKNYAKGDIWLYLIFLLSLYSIYFAQDCRYSPLPNCRGDECILWGERGGEGVSVAFILTLHKKWSFSLRISSVNVTQSAVSWRNLLKKSLTENFIFSVV